MAEMRKFGDFATFKYGKMPNKKKLTEMGKYPVYSGYRYVGYYDEYNTEAGQIIVVARGVGGTGDVKLTKERCYLTNLSISADIDENIALPEYIYYYYLLRNLRYLDSGSAQSQITISDLEKVMIPLPSLVEQRAICDYMKMLDKKIEINEEINDNLSDQIQAIYSNVFDPTTHTPTGVLADICGYSSDRIPVAELSASTYFSTENMQPNKLGSVDATSLPSISQTTGCHNGDVLVSNIRPYFKKIVYVTDDCCGCSTDVLCFVPKEKQYSAFLFGTLYMDRFFEYMVAGSKGTKMPRGDKKQIMNYPIVLPDKESLALFNGLTVPMLEQIATNRIESSRLASFRDALLPKLMSGELDVSSLDL